MISVGLLPITSDLQKFYKNPAGMFVEQASAKQLEELREVRRLATKLPTLSDDMLEEQRSAFEAAASSTADAQASAEPTDTAVETRWG